MDILFISKPDVDGVGFSVGENVELCIQATTKNSY